MTRRSIGTSTLHLKYARHDRSTRYAGKEIRMLSDKEIKELQERVEYGPLRPIRLTEKAEQ